MDKNNEPIISVLMPVYNAERYVAQAVESILKQTFEDFEFIIIDDGSTDHSLKILKKYAAQDQRIRLISRPNIGLVGTLNEMLHLAKGEWLARIDADDIALPERLAHQLEFLQKNPDVICLGGAVEMIDEQDRLLTRLKVPENNEQIQQKALAGHTTIIHPAAIIHRASALQVGGYDEEAKYAEDLDLWLKLGEIGQLANLTEVVVKYRQHNNSMSGTNSLDQFNQMRKICERAWQRRGIQGHFESEKPWRAEKDRVSQHNFMLKYGWWAFNSGQRQTAIIYGFRAIQALPFRLKGWKLLINAAIKPMSPIQSQS